MLTHPEYYKIIIKLLLYIFLDEIQPCNVD